MVWERVNPAKLNVCRCAEEKTVSDWVSKVPMRQATGRINGGTMPITSQFKSCRFFLLG